MSTALKEFAFLILYCVQELFFAYAFQGSPAVALAVRSEPKMHDDDLSLTSVMSSREVEEATLNGNVEIF